MMTRALHKIPQLPMDFAQQILDCDIEITLSDDPPRSAFKNLTELYMMGVQYYESIRNYRYIYFQKKMNGIFKLTQSIQFSNADLQKQQCKSPLKTKMNSKNQAERIQALMIKQKHEKLKSAINQSTLSKNTGSQVKDFIVKSDILLTKYQSKLKQQINGQEKRLHFKILQRKMSNLNRSSIDRNFRQLRDQSTRSSLCDQSETINDEVVQLRTKPKQPLNFNLELISIVDQQEDEQVQNRKRELSHKGQNVKISNQKKLQRNWDKLKKSTSEVIKE